MAKKIITLKNANPIASEMWDFKLNEKLHPGMTPDNVASDSMNKAWFKCTDNPVHIFKTKIKDMTDRKTGKNCGCVFCGPCADDLPLSKYIGKRKKDILKDFPLGKGIDDCDDADKLQYDWSDMTIEVYLNFMTVRQIKITMKKKEDIGKNSYS